MKMFNKQAGVTISKCEIEEVFTTVGVFMGYGHMPIFGSSIIERFKAVDQFSFTVLPYTHQAGVYITLLWHTKRNPA